MIGVGINENVIITKALMNDKKRLTIELSAAGTKKAAGPRNYFDESLTAGVEADTAGMLLSILGPLVSTKTDKTQEEKLDMLANDFKRLKNQLTQILMQYMTVESIDITSMDVQYANTGLTVENFAQVALEQDKVNKRYENICNRFIELITPFLGNDQYALRFKLLRQSKDKHYATVPSRYVAENPFVELMEVPAEATRVKFTDWEKKEGLDSGVPISGGAEKKDAPPAGAAPAVIKNPFAPQS